MTGWTIALSDPRSDSRTDEVHTTTAAKLRMDRRGTIEETLAAYVRGKDGRDPVDQGARIDPVLAAVAAHHGIVPLRFLRAKHLGLGFGAMLLHDDDASSPTHFHDEYMPDIGGIANIVQGLSYSASLVNEPTVMLVHYLAGDIPDTLRLALVGRPLSDLVAIPGLTVSPRIVARRGGEEHDRFTIERLPSVPCAEVAERMRMAA